MNRFRIISLFFIVLLPLAVLAYLRSGVLNLPRVPERLTPSAAGLLNLDEMKRTERAILSDQFQHKSQSEFLAFCGLREVRRGNGAAGIRLMQDAIRVDPQNLVIGNKLRMVALSLKRSLIKTNAIAGKPLSDFPAFLKDEPTRFFRELVQTKPFRELKLQLALCLVDEMLISPALEIKAPASVEAVEILTSVLREGKNQNAYYVPALVVRGLNYLHRPFNLVWPERIASASDAASRDLSLAFAIGVKLSMGSPRLRAHLAIALGDAFAKEGKYELARSWWQVAKNLDTHEETRNIVFHRLTWDNDQILNRLEKTLEEEMQNVERPLSDLSFMWS